MWSRRVWVAGCLSAVLTIWAARPVRYVVDGPSMAPGLASGDVVASGVFPIRDRFRTPRRFERWVLATTDGAEAVKRVVGLPGETVSIAAGDLVIDGGTVLKGPRLLAGLGCSVEGVPPPHGDAWRMEPREILDDVGVAVGRTVRLLPVRDVGFAAVCSAASSPVGRAASVRAVVGRTAVAWRLAAGGRCAIVAGRLDGHVVAAAWPLSGADAESAGADRSCLPPHPPEDWSVALPWPDGEPVVAPRLELAGDSSAAVAAVTIERVTLWRDVLYRPVAEDVTSWSIGPGAVFALGDYPATSRDSRQWGAMPLTALRHRVAAVRLRSP